MRLLRFRTTVAPFVLVSGLALLLRVLAVAGDTSPPQSDGISYDKFAVSLVSGNGYGYGPGLPTAWLMPGYSLVLAAVYAMVGHDLGAARLANAALGALTCVLIVVLGRRVFGPAVGLLAGLYAAASPFFIGLAGRLFTENLYMPLLVLTALAFQETLSRERLRDFLGFGLWASLSILTKPLTVPFFLTALVFMLWQRPPWRAPRVARGLAVTLVVFLLPMGVWTARNALALGAFVPLATQGGDTFYVSYNPVDGKIFGRRFDDDPVYVEANRRYPLLSHEVERSRYLMEAGIQTIREHPERLPRLTLLKVLYFWSPFDWEILEHGRYNAATATLLPFLILGLLAVGREWPRYASVLLPPASMFALGLLFYGSPRVRLTVEPFLIVLGVGGAVWLWTRVRRPALLACTFGGWIALNGLLAVSGETAKTAARALVHAAGFW